MDKFIKVCSRLIKRYFADGVSRASAQLAYYLIFSLFPIIILLNTIISRFGMDIITILYRYERFFPQQVLGIVIEYLNYLSGIDVPYIFMIGLTMTLYALTRCLNSLLTSVRQAYRIKKAGIVNYMTAAIFSAIILLSFFLLGLAVAGSDAVIAYLEYYIRIPDSVYGLLRLLRVILVPGWMLLVLSGFYYLVPSRRYPYHTAIPGTIFAVVGITTITSVFSYYISNFSNYSLVYGSLAAVIILMLWLQLVATMLIMGGELNDVLIEMDKD